MAGKITVRAVYPITQPLAAKVATRGSQIENQCLFIFNPKGQWLSGAVTSSDIPSYTVLAFET